MAIKITAKKVDKNLDLLSSRFFGAPVVPEEWLDKFPEEVIFFAQICLSDIAELDKENKLPHTGYLYLFLDTEVYPYTAWAEYYNGTPRLVIDDFNELEPRFSHLNQSYVMEFSECEDDYEGTKLFGTPSFDIEDDVDLCLQFDPLQDDMGFLDNIDGYAYFIFGEGEDRINNIRFHVERT